MPSASSAGPLAESQTTPDPLSMRAVLRIPQMRGMWLAQIVSNLGDFLALFAVISTLTFVRHASAQQITGVQIAYLLPMALLGIIAGVFVDRWPLKLTMVASDLTRAGIVLLLIASTRTWHFYLALAAISMVSSFFVPAQGVAIRSVVPAHGLQSANALMQQIMFIMRIAGPMIAGLIVASFGPRVCYWVDAASFVASACLIGSLAIQRSEHMKPKLSVASAELQGLARVFEDMKQGIHFIKHHAEVLFVMIALASAVFVLGCFGPLIAVYVRESLHASTRVFGIASAAIGFGMMFGINGITVCAKRVKGSTLIYAGLATIAAGLILLTLLTHIWSTILGSLIIGAGVSAIIVPSQTVIQLETPPALLGRVGSTSISFIFTAQIAGLLLSGQLAAHIGVRNVFALCAVLLFILIAIGRLWMEPKPAAVTPASP